MIELLDIMQFGYDVGTDIIGSLIFIAFQGLFILSLFLFRRHRLRKLFKIKTCITSRKNPIIFDGFYANSGRYDVEEKAFYSYPCEYLAVGKMEAYLRKCWKNSSVKLEIGPMKKADANRIPTENNLLLVGGPFHNLMTGYIFGMIEEHSNVPFYFGPSVIGKDENGKDKVEDATLFFKRNAEGEPKKYVPDTDAEGLYTKDYGIILNIKNPYNPKKRLIALLGCRTFGVLGAATFFTEHSKKLKHSFRHWRIPDEYGIIVETRNDGKHLENNFVVCEAFKINSIVKEKLTKEFINDLERMDIGKIEK